MSESKSLPGIERVNGYAQWVEAQGVPVFEGFYLPSIRTVEVGDWPQKDGRGTIVRLQGAEDWNDAHIVEIPPAGKLAPQKHLYEELVYIVQGTGSTRIWNGRGEKATFEWGAGSVFSVPLNAHYQHYNGSGSESVRYYAVTSAPVVMKLFHNESFVFDCDFDFTDRFSGEEDYFSGEGRSYANRVVETNFLPDVNKVALQSWAERGAGSTNLMFEIAHNTLCGHISEFPVGTYKKAHRHAAGANVIILGGEGFSLLWREGEPIQKVDWSADSVVVPPDRWFHQHFNVGGSPARYLALRWGSERYHFFKDYYNPRPTAEGGDQIEYRDEDPYVRQTFEAELSRRGLRSHMGEHYGT